MQRGCGNSVTEPVMKRKISPFFLCVVDSDRKIFSIEGPMVNDEPWNEAVVKAQSSGRAVHCFSLPGEADRMALEKSHAAQTSFEAKEPGSIVSPNLLTK
jgi:hypothetical protein